MPTPGGVRPAAVHCVLLAKMLPVPFTRIVLATSTKHEVPFADLLTAPLNVRFDFGR